MALIECSDCRRQISDSALTCPSCGCQTGHAPKPRWSVVQSVGLLLAAIGITLGSVTGSVFAIGFGVLAIVLVAIKMLGPHESSNKRTGANRE